MGRFCSQAPHSSISPWRASASPASTKPALGTCVIRASRWMVTTTSSPRSSTKALAGVLLGHGHLAAIEKTRRAPTRCAPKRPAWAVTGWRGCLIPGFDPLAGRTARRAGTGFGRRESKAESVPARAPRCHRRALRSAAVAVRLEFARSGTRCAPTPLRLGHGLGLRVAAVAASPWPNRVGSRRLRRRAPSREVREPLRFPCQCNRCRRQVLAGRTGQYSRSPTRFHPIQHHCGGHGPARTAHTQDDLLVVSRLHRHGPARTRFTPADHRPALQERRNDAAT